MNAFTQKPDVSGFLRDINANHRRSVTVSRACQERNIVQSASLTVFTKPQRQGRKTITTTKSKP